MESLADLLGRLEQRIEDDARAGNARAYFDAWREVLRCYEKVGGAREDPEPAAGEREYAKLYKMAEQAMRILAGQSEPSLNTLDRYDPQRYGPMLGVSDEGSASKAIRDAALRSPKCAVLTERTPMTVGVALDAERLGAVGEVAVGPDEYCAIRLQCMGRILSTTNVGARVNLRHYLMPPVVKIKPGTTEEAVAAACRDLAREFERFWKTPTGRPRKRTVLVRFERQTPPNQRLAILQGLQKAMAGRTFCDGGKKHRLGLLAMLGPKANGLDEAKAAVDLASRIGLAEVALGGKRAHAMDEDELPGLLDYLEPEEAADLVAYAAKRRILVVPEQRVDPQTTARHVWTGLVVARNMGLELGKYGLSPLTFEEQKEVVARIQYWLPHWCAAPACYIDSPLVAKDHVYHGASLARGISRWLQMVAKLGVRVVLIDTARKWESRRLLQEGPEDARGLLSLDEIRQLDAYAAKLGVKALWAGGISLPQTFEFGKLGVFGIYVTSAAATLVPLDRHYRRDPSLAAVREPDTKAVGRVKLLLEAGFLVNRLQALGLTERARALEEEARALIALLGRPGKNGKNLAQARQEAAVHALAVDAWKTHLGKRKGPVGVGP